MTRIAITHHNADLDALASLIAAARLYDAVPLRGRAVSPPVKRYLALHKDHFPLTWYHEVDPEEVDSVVVVDVRKASRLKEYAEMIDHADEVIVYDHHPASADDLETPQATVAPTGACVTLLIEELRQRGRSVNGSEATLMLLGLYADTGRLSFDRTKPRDIDAAAWLLRRGANLSVVNRYLEEEFSPEQRQLLIQMVGQAEEVSHQSVEIAIGTAQAERSVRGASAVVHRVMRMGGHDVMFGVFDFTKDTRIQIIGRSRVPYVHVGEILGELGGGGHPGAAACTIKKRPLEEVLTQLREVIASTALRPTRVADMMTAPVQTVDHRDTLEDLRGVLDGFRIRGVPVMRDGEMCGVISIRDLRRAMRQRADMTLPVSARMTHEVCTITPNEPIEDALEIMTEQDIGRLPVLDDSGRLVGIVSRTDILATLYAQEEAPETRESL